MKKLTRETLSKIKLEDDNSVPYGGISYCGETADNFCDEVYNGEDNSWDKHDWIYSKELNDALKECGIKALSFDD